MAGMPIPARRLLPLVLTGVLGASVAACGAYPPPVGASPRATAAGTAPASTTTGPSSPEATEDLTPVPGGVSPSPDDTVGGGPTAETDWGTILVNLPEGFPRFPGSAGVDPMDGPASDALEVVAPVEEVAAWYQGAFEELGWSHIDLGSPLEDGSQVLDLASDLPECRVQLSFRPLGGSTMITVLYGAGCAGGDG
jgi:hypothetical protein